MLEIDSGERDVGDSITGGNSVADRMLVEGRELELRFRWLSVDGVPEGVAFQPPNAAKQFVRTSVTLTIRIDSDLPGEKDVNCALIFSELAALAPGQLDLTM